MSEMAGAFADIGKFMKAQRELAEVSMSQMARMLKVSERQLQEYEGGSKAPTPDLMQQFTQRLGIDPASLSKKNADAFALLLPTLKTSVPDAVLADSKLTEAQKDAFVQMYRSIVDGDA